MGQFDIVRSGALPQGPLGTVRARIDTRTGEGLIGRAIEGAGKDLQQKVEEVQLAQDRLEISTGQRKIREKIIAAQNSVTGDKEKDDVIWANAEKEINAISGNNRRVNSELQMFRDSTIPQASGDFVRKHTTKKAKNIHDQFEAEGQTLLANGDLIGYQSLLDARLDSNDLTRAGYDSLSKSAFGDSLLQQARDAIASKTASERARGLGILENMDKLEGVSLSTEQLEYRNKLKKLGVSSSTEAQNASIASVIVRMDNQKNLSALEKNKAAQEMKQQLVTEGVTGDNLNQYFKEINKWADTDKPWVEQYDEVEYAKTLQQVLLAPETTSPAEIYAKVGLPENNLSVDKAKSLVEEWESRINKVPSLQKGMLDRRMSQLEALYKAGKLGATDGDGLKAYNDMADRMMKWGASTKDFTSQEMDKFYDELTYDTRKTWWKDTWWSTFVPAVSYFKALGLSGDVRVARARAEKEVSRITRLREKIQTQAWARNYIREKGIVRQTDDGKQWVLTKKGDSPAQDEYEEMR
jgi:hypothetical protein